MLIKPQQFAIDFDLRFFFTKTWFKIWNSLKNEYVQDYSKIKFLNDYGKIYNL